MINQAEFDNYIFSDGQLLSVICNFGDCSIEVRLQVRKKLAKQILPCVVCLRFEIVYKFDLLENFGTSGVFSDIVLQKYSDTQFYASFDPYGNSGEPHEKDNFVIKAAECKIEELSAL